MEGSLADESKIDPVYRKTCKFLAKFRETLDEMFYEPVDCPMGSHKIFSKSFENRHNERNRMNSLFSTDFNDFKYYRILSTDKCQFQPNHADYASKGKYF